MRRARVIGLFQTCSLLWLLSCGLAAEVGAGTSVSGVVQMPDVCSPAISPAAVYLTPSGSDQNGLAPRAPSQPGKMPSAEVVLVNQRELQFMPRVRAIALGQTVRFGNQDGETHNVHIVSPGFAFNQAMAPGQFQDFTPTQPGVMRLACDIHMHMRGYVIVSPTRWAQVCGREGRFRLDDVSEGRYVLTAWHEMGDPVQTEITVTSDANSLVVPAIVLTSSLGPTARRMDQKTARVRRWPDVIDRISVALAASRDAAARPNELAKARRLAEDAYWVEFESSDMETAVRKYLGYVRAGELERQFHAIRTAVRDVAVKRMPREALAQSCHKLLHDLLEVSNALDAKGITDPTRIDALGGQSGAEARPGVLPTELAPATGFAGDPRALLQALKSGLRRVEEYAVRGESDDAASELTTVYMTEFEPLERYLMGRNPQAVRPLEMQFNRLRGDLAGGLSGDKLSSRVNGLTNDVENLVDRLESRPVGTFGAAFVASLITILREGVEVILVVAMLLALVARATTGSVAPTHDEVKASAQTKVRASRAIWRGVGLAAVASLVTAVVLNVMVINAQGAAREILEGVVMLAASGVLFYVSYWLVSQLEAKRWMDFLKTQARHGLELGGQGTLALTAFLAVYREGAETSLMYQALLGSEGRTQSGFLGLIIGLGLGLILLALVAALIRQTSVRLPMHVFFKFSGLFLFALAIVFAGNGVFELQNAGILLTTNLAWMGRGLPWAGIYPNLQVVSVQGMLLAGAVLAWVVVPRLSWWRAGGPAASGIGLAPKQG
jgi:high-affinity iron transporter